MKLLSNYEDALSVDCPYCHAKAGERCRVVNGNIHTVGSEPRDQYGRPLIHEARVNKREFIISTHSLIY